MHSGGVSVRIQIMSLQFHSLPHIFPGGFPNEWPCQVLGSNKTQQARELQLNHRGKANARTTAEPVRHSEPANSSSIRAAPILSVVMLL